MPALKPTDFVADVVWLGHVVDRSMALTSSALDRVDVGFEGIASDCHSGLTRPSCSRVRSLHPRGTEIRNSRQISVVSREELDATARAMGLEALDPALVGASLVVAGIPDFTLIPPSSRLQGPSGVTFIVDMENRPCHLPAKEIERKHKGYGPRYKSAAQGRRGVTLSVERSGSLSLGDQLRLHIPDQPAWPHIDLARQT